MSRFSRHRPGPIGAPVDDTYGGAARQSHADRQRRAEEARTLYRAGFERYGRHGWWRRKGSGNAPAMSQGEALMRARRELFLRASHAQLTSKGE